MTLAPQGNAGNYFSRQTRTSSRFEWRETWSLSRKAWGTHNLKFGSLVGGTAEHGLPREHPVNIVDAAGTLLENISFTGGRDISRTGQSGYNIGTLVTKSLVIAGDSLITTAPSGARGAMLRAYDKTSGKEVGSVLMPAPQSGSPMTYMWNGKQYIVIAVSGGAYSGEYRAYRLPDER